jgi:3-oxoadipate enol-lactonase
VPHLNINGTPLYYELSGKADAPVIAFLSGLTGDHNNWSLQVAYFAPHYRCLTFDWRDTGQSGVSPIADYTLAEMADDVAQMIWLLGLGKCHVVGLSMGGAVAQHLGLEFPEQVASLTLACSFAVRPHPMELPPKLQTPGNLRHVEAIKRHDTRDQLPFLNLPVLVLAGDKDRSTPPDDQREYSLLLPDARFVVIPNGGHFLHLEKAGEFNRQVSAFLETLKGE